MIGARDMAFPRLNALSYWLFLFGGIVIYSASSSSGGAREVGLVRLPAALGELLLARATARTSGSSRCTSVAISSLVGAINFIVTIHNMRAPGMTLDAAAALRLVDRDLLDPARRSCCRCSSAGLTLLLLDRQVGHALLPARPGRERGPLPARLLVLRPPRGLHHDPARDGDDLGDHPRLLAQADLRLQGDRVLDDRDRLLLDARLGAPHVQRSGCRASSTSSSCSRRW